MDIPTHKSYRNKAGYEISTTNRRPIHRLVMETHLGRRLKPFEVVHHKDGVRHNNKLSNLEVLRTRDHCALHHTIHGLYKTRVYRTAANRRYLEKHWKRLAPILRKRSRDYYWKHHRKCLVAANLYRKNNPDKVKENWRKYYLKYKNPLLEERRLWRKDNPVLARVRDAMYREKYRKQKAALRALPKAA